jgi:hypothetical protein
LRYGSITLITVPARASGGNRMSSLST